MQDIDMKENWYALIICILSTVTRDQAFRLMAGAPTYARLTEEDIKDTVQMIEHHNQGLSYKEIGELWGLKAPGVCKRIQRYMKKQEVKKCMN